MTDKRRDDREEMPDIPVGRVTAGRGWQIGIVALFLAIIVSAPLSQIAIERLRREPVQELDVFGQPLTHEALSEYERALERNSKLAAGVRREMQWLMLGSLKSGNEKCVVGVDGSLFFRPSLAAVTGPGDGVGEDGDGRPLPAILRFRDSLAAQGVRLKLLVVPGKETIYPEWLSARYRAADGPPRNVGVGSLLQELADQGVEVLDAAPILWEAKGASDLYLRQDTHWSPEGLDVIADALAERLADLVGESRPFVAQPTTITNHGDLFDMLDLPPRQGLLVSEAVTVSRVANRATGDPIETDPSSPIALLGDSFANVYSLASMNWGDHAGLGEQLALRLGRSVDVIAHNDGGVNTSRATLCRRAKPLAGKRVVVWEFAERELTSGSEWKVMEVTR